MEKNHHQKWFLICACKPEWSELKKKAHFEINHTLHNLNFYTGKFESHEFLLSQIGIGIKRSEKHAHTLLSSLVVPPKGIIHFGLAGALKEKMKEGEVILSPQIVSPTGEIISPSSDLLQKAESLLQTLKIPFTKGNIFTSNKILETPNEKKEAGKKWGAIAVDMESFPYAKKCSERGIPYLSIRAIFDPLEWDLRLPSNSSGNLLQDNGDLNTGFFVKEVFKNPKFLMSLPHYQSAASKGNKVLNRFLLAALKKWG